MKDFSFEKVKMWIKQELVLTIALLLGCVSSFFNAPKMHYIDWDVLAVLWALMVVVAGLKTVKFLDWTAIELLNRCATYKQVVIALVGLNFVSSMFVTNDVALLTFVPLALVIGKTIKMDMPRVVILQTLAANLGSMFTPPGNPQNLFLYAHYGYSALGFFKVMLLPTVLSVIYIGVIIYFKRNHPLQLELPALERPDRKLTTIYLVLLALNVGAVLHIMDKYIALAITAIVVLVVNRKLVKQVDYSLLLTFIGFFVFIGNISNTSVVSYLRDHVLGTTEGTYLAALVSSQFISNVPAAMLLAGLTREADALLLGVNIGGLGTLIASMASVISYKLFAAEHPYQAGGYLRMFLFYNFVGLVLIGFVTYLACIVNYINYLDVSQFRELSEFLNW
ncbi:MAG: citrate transporter [Phascolarctobacterium sp.]|nr:citrate transporter [Phascolarctobacterium sp.]